MKSKRSKSGVAQGLSTVASFNELIPFREFDQFVRARHRHPFDLVYTDTCRTTAKAKYRANVTTHDSKELLYLFIPRSKNGRKFWSISRRVLKEENEASEMEILDAKFSMGSYSSIGNTPRITHGRKNK